MSVDALAEEFDVSLETIRRDLGKLAQTGVLQKVHGGAKPAQLHSEGTFAERLAQDTTAKRIIADKLLTLVEPGDTIFIDTGSTTLAAANALTAIDDLTVITNSVRIAQMMGRRGKTSIYLLGGGFSPDNEQTYGPMVLEQIGRFHADSAILTVAALDNDTGAMDANLDEASVARVMISHAQRTVILAHCSKLGRRAGFPVCRLDEIDVLVCDEMPSAQHQDALHAAGCVIH